MFAKEGVDPIWITNLMFQVSTALAQVLLLICLLT